MSIPNPQRTRDIRRIIDEFLLARLNDRLEKVKDDESEPANLTAKRIELRQQFDFAVWIDDAARRAAWIQAVTHSLKPIHPDARGTNLYISPTALPDAGLVGSHSLGSDFEGDVVGNAAALDVYKFLKLSFEGSSLLELMLAGDTDFPAALSDDVDQSVKWIAAFTSITKPRGAASSHTLAKQIYWLTGNDQRDDGSYHLLAPLFATSLTHRVYQTINADRFSEASKNARQARRDEQFTEHVLHDYPNMAVQKLGGTKPQNISQLNSERRGENYLLASLPPRWKSIHLKPLLNTDSMFHGFGRRPDVKQGVKALLAFLMTDPPSNKATRDFVDALVDELVGELLVFGAELRALPPGWSQSTDCRLNAAERYWLDPEGVENAVEQSGQALPAGRSEQISQAFGRWLNRQLRDPLPMGDSEYLHWCALAQTELDAEEPEVHHAG